MGYAEDIIKESLDEALFTMESMCANEGQTSVFQSQVVPAFTENSQAAPDDGWEDVDIGGYMDFMGEIVEEGNTTMQFAYEEAAAAAEIEDLANYF